MGARRTRSKAKKNRLKNAIEAQNHLTTVVNNTTMPLTVRENAVRHLLTTSRRNRISVPKNVSHRICKKCKSILLVDKNSRIRIRNGQKIVTCLKCKSVRRIGGGPKYHRSVKNG